MKINWCKIFGHKEIPVTFKMYLEDGTIYKAHRTFFCKRCCIMDKELSEEDKINMAEYMNKEYSLNVVRFGELTYNK